MAVVPLILIILALVCGILAAAGFASRVPVLAVGLILLSVAALLGAL